MLQYMASKKSPLLEDFMDDQTFAAQVNFIDKKVAAAKVGDAALDIPTNPNPQNTIVMPNAKDVKKAVEDIDLFVERQEPNTENWFTDVFTSPIYLQDKACRAITSVYNLPNDDSKQRIDCGWMFNPNGQSASVLCSPWGPVFNFSQMDYPSSEYKFTWSKNEAIRLEEVKKCAQTTQCELLEPGKGCGFCPALSRAIPALNDGSSKYTGSDQCPYLAIMEPSKCYLPVSQGGAGLSDGSGSCTPDAQGKLSKVCLTALAKQAGCTDKGTVLQALEDNSNPQMSSQKVKDVASVLQSYQFSIPTGVLSDGSVSISDALMTYWNMSWQSVASPNVRVRGAAGNLCYGRNFDPCDYDDSDVAQFPLNCLQNLYYSSGCQSKGLDFPTVDNLASFQGKSWGQIKKNLNSLIAKMTNPSGSVSPADQKDALQRCIGTHLRRRAITYCNELGLSIKIYFMDNGVWNFFGRYIVTNEFFLLRNESTFWDSLLVFNSPLTQGKNILLSLETNINPNSQTTLNYTRIGNITDSINYNGTNVAAKYNTWISQDPVANLQVTPNNQENQNLQANIQLTPDQYTQRNSIWYLADGAANQPDINIFRLPIERRSPLINIVMNQGDISDITNTVQLNIINLSPTSLGNQSCTLFNGGGYIQIKDSLRTQAFRSYTSMIWCSQPGLFPRVWSFSVGQQQSYWYFNWGAGWNGKGWGWQQEVYYARNYGSSTIAIGLEMEYNGTGIFTQIKNPNATLGPGGQIPLNTWKHVTVVMSADFTTATTYVDGQLVGTSASTTNPDVITNDNFIGYAFPGETSPFNGGMQWFRAFDYALTPEDIAQDMDDDW